MNSEKINPLKMSISQELLETVKEEK